MKAKLGYLCSSESWGGLEMNHLRNADWMNKRGHDVVFLCIKDSPIDKQAASFQLPVIHIDKHKKYYDFAKAHVLAKTLVDASITHLIIRSTYDIGITASVKRKLGDKLHTSYFMEMQLGVKKTDFLHTLRFRYIDVWSCPLNWLKTQVEELTKFRNKLVVIPSAMDLSQFENLPSTLDSRKLLDLPVDAFIFGLIGRFDAQKGQLLLLEAMSKSKHKDYAVVLLGEPTLNEGDAYFNQMKSLIEEKELSERVFIRPYRKDAETFYNAIDWLVMATKAETFGMVTIEALASGKPVLGSNAGGTPEILQNGVGGQLFETLDAQDLADQLDKILDEDENRDSEQLKAMAKVYDHVSVCEQVEEVLGLV